MPVMRSAAVLRRQRRLNTSARSAAPREKFFYVDLSRRAPRGANLQDNNAMFCDE